MKVSRLYLNIFKEYSDMIENLVNNLYIEAFEKQCKPSKLSECYCYWYHDEVKFFIFKYNQNYHLNFGLKEDSSDSAHHRINSKDTDIVSSVKKRRK